MPANLTPEYREAQRAFKEASTIEERITALEHMLAVIPKHKGTEKMQGDLRRRLARLRQESEQPRKGGPARGAPVYQVKKEGAGQVALAGSPNTGKSALVRRLTHAAPEVANYPFTTRVPTPGMMNFEDIQIQLVDLPPLDAQFGEAWVPQTIRNADAVLVVVDLAALALLDQMENTVAMLEKAKVFLNPGQPLPLGSAAKPALVVANKLDLPGARENFAVLRELYSERFRVVSVSAETGEGFEELRQAVFGLLNVVRVYTKEPGKKPDLARPYVLRAGATVADLAGRVHKDILANLKYARVWSWKTMTAGSTEGGSSTGHNHFEGQMVHRDYRLADRDVVELHA